MTRIIVDYHNQPQKKVTIGGKIYSYRSKGECNLALYLQFLKEQKLIKDWAFEQTTFTFPNETKGAKQFLVDFDVLYNSGNFEYWEYKGWLQGVDVTKFRRVAKYRPEVKLVLVMSGKKKKDFNRIRMIKKYSYRVIYANELFSKVKGIVRFI